MVTNAFLADAAEDMEDLKAKSFIEPPKPKHLMVFLGAKKVANPDPEFVAKSQKDANKDILHAFGWKPLTFTPRDADYITDQLWYSNNRNSKYGQTALSLKKVIDYDYGSLAELNDRLVGSIVETQDTPLQFRPKDADGNERTRYYRKALRIVSQEEADRIIAERAAQNPEKSADPTADGSVVVSSTADDLFALLSTLIGEGATYEQLRANWTKNADAKRNQVLSQGIIGDKPLLTRFLSEGKLVLDGDVYKVAA